MRTALSVLVSADSAEQAADALEAEPRLLDDAWQPVVERVGDLLVELQQDEDARSAVRDRLATLRRARLGWGPRTDAAQEQAAALLTRMLEIEASPARTPEDLREAVPAGKQLVSLCREAFGPHHRMTLTAMSDTAAIMLDDLGAGASPAELRELLDQAFDACVRAESPLLADVTTNLALARLRPDRVADFDTLGDAADMLDDALHLSRLFHPGRPEQSLALLVNHATLMRSEFTGDMPARRLASLALFDRVLASPDLGRLGPVDRATIASNRLNVLSDLLSVNATEDVSHDPGTSRILAAIDDVDAALRPLGDKHPVRLTATTNLASTAAGLLAAGFGGEYMSVRAAAWAGDAYARTRDHPEDHPTRVLAGKVLALVRSRQGEDGRDEAERLLVECAGALAGGESSRLHHTVVGNLGRLHLSRGDWPAAATAFGDACDHADTVIARAKTPAARLAHVATAGDLFRRLALCRAHLEDPQGVVHAIERSRARWLAPAGYAGPSVDQGQLDLLEPGTVVLYLGTTDIGSYGTALVAGSGGGGGSARPASAALVADRAGRRYPPVRGRNPPGPQTARRASLAVRDPPDLRRRALTPTDVAARVGAEAGEGEGVIVTRGACAVHPAARAQR